MSIEHFDRQRRNLFAISVGVIIFYLLDAEFGTKGSILMGSIEFDKNNRFILLYALWIGFIYYYWRFYIYGGKNALRDTHKVFGEFLLKDEKFKKHLRDKFKDEIIENAKEKIANIGPEPDYGILDYKLKKLSPIFIVAITFHVQFGKQHHSRHKEYETRFFRHPIVGFRVIRKVMFAHSGFGEYMLPHIIAWWAFCYIAMDIIGGFLIR